jgi:hypothetical protein
MRVTIGLPGGELAWCFAGVSYPFLAGSFLRFVFAKSLSWSSDIDSAIFLEAPFRLDFWRSPRFAASAAPSDICCFFDSAGISDEQIHKMIACRRGAGCMIFEVEHNKLFASTLAQWQSNRGATSANYRPERSRKSKWTYEFIRHQSGQAIHLMNSRHLQDEQTK